ncbi:MAG: BrnT family toxin [Gemmatimonadales bacterium]
MGALHFDWDPAKAASNLRKHGVPFEEAESVFSDEQGLLLDDDRHSDAEPRFALLGLSATLRVLVVVHCYRAAGATIRIISARKATPAERAQYVARWES